MNILSTLSVFISSIFVTCERKTFSLSLLVSLWVPKLTQLMSIKCNRLLISPLIALFFSSSTWNLSHLSLSVLQETTGNTRYIFSWERTERAKCSLYINIWNVWERFDNIFISHCTVERKCVPMSLVYVKTAHFYLSLSVTLHCFCRQDEHFLHRLLNLPHLHLTRFAWMHCFTFHLLRTHFNPFNCC